MNLSRHLRITLVACILVVNIVVMALVAYSLDRSKTQHQQRAQTLTQNIAVALNQNVSNRIQKIDLTLRTIVDELERQLSDKGLDTAAVTAMLSRHEQRLPEVEALRIADANGLVILGKGVSTQNPASWGDRDYFVHLREHADGGLQISKPRIGRVAKQYIIGFARRYNYPDGRFAGVISAPIALEHFTQLLGQFDLGIHGTLILRDTDFGLITRIPALPGQAVGAVGNADVSQEFRKLANSGVQTSTYYLNNSPDGFERILTFRRMVGAPMLVIAGSASNDYLEDWYQERNRAVGAAVGLLLFSGVLGVLLLRLLAPSQSDQAQIKESENRLRAIVENEPECIKVIDKEGRLLQMNPAGLRMVEADTHQQVAGQLLVNLIAPEYREAFLEMHRRVIGGEPMQMEFEVLGLHGGRRMLETHAVPMQVLGEVVHLAVTRDISERKAYEDGLKHAKKAAEAANIAKSRFLATMSHEIRTPMNGILGMAQMLLQPNLQDEQRNDYARTILSSGQTLLSLLNDILDLSKIEAGKFQLESTAFAPEAMMHETINLFAGAAQTKGLELDCQWHGASDQRYLADSHRLRQMLSNLVGNAIKFTRSGQVRIEARAMERTEGTSVLEFAVSDTGIGIPADKLDLLFKPFSQTDSSTTREFGGSGLGLSIVSHLAKAMGGETGVSSELGQGSRFWFRVKVQNITENRNSRKSERRPLDTHSDNVTTVLQGHVLVVEDNLVNCMVIESLLNSVGLIVSVVHDGQKAVELIEHHDGGANADTPTRPDLILMDLHMPVMDGYTATERIRQWEASTQHSPLPIIALTADAYEEDRQHCLAIGMNDFLCKPIALDELKVALARWLPAGAAAQAVNPGPKTLKPLDMDAFDNLVRELTPLLQENRFAAVGHFKSLQNLVRGTNLEDEFDALAPMLHEMRFDLVLQRLLEIDRNLRAQESI
jgi:PAS domain S-box-containing protein